MTRQAHFALRGRNPDVLTCIANLSNDEVFTPPEFANRMLDTLEQAWAEANGGESIWSNPDVKFLDPFTKTGVFLREVTKRLMNGLESQIPDPETRIDNILTRQVFGIGITQLTSLLARRSVYCSKYANGAHSIAKSFTNDAGNIWFERTEHSWDGDKCRFCGASRGTLDRGESLETYAYPFTHTDNIKAFIAEIFGDHMQFDVIIGNPPYQLKGGSGGTNDASIYPQFVDQARALDARFLVMVIPSRWLAGGRDMGDFRDSMLKSGRLRRFVDYTQMSVAFPNSVDFEGGVGYFLWDRDSTGRCQYTLHLADNKPTTVERDLDEFDIFVRDIRALEVLKKVRALKESTLDLIISGDTPFGLATNFSDYRTTKDKNSIPLYMTIKQKREVVYVNEDLVRKNRQLIPTWKLFIPKAYGERGAIPAYVLGPTIVAGPSDVCSQTYVVLGPLDSEEAALSVESYLQTRLVRLLISLRKITQDLPRGVYAWVPQQSWDRTWTDADLYRKYGITTEEQTFIEAMIRPMNLTGNATDE